MAQERPRTWFFTLELYHSPPGKCNLPCCKKQWRISTVFVRYDHPVPPERHSRSKLSTIPAVFAGKKGARVRAASQSAHSAAAISHFLLTQTYYFGILGGFTRSRSMTSRMARTATRTAAEVSKSSV
jgi:hypothetical protein